MLACSLALDDLLLLGVRVLRCRSVRTPAPPPEVLRPTFGTGSRDIELLRFPELIPAELTRADAPPPPRPGFPALL